MSNLGLFVLLLVFTGISYLLWGIEGGIAVFVVLGALWVFRGDFNRK